MKSAAAAALVMLLLAGCSGSKEEPPATFTCPNGKVVQVPANMTATPAAACPPPVPPSVVLDQVPADVRIHQTASFAWSIAPGEYASGHSMLSSLRVSATPVADATLQGPDSFGTELARKEHQNLPMSATVEHTFPTAGTYYVRVYATIQADGLPAADFWTPEQVLVVADVTPTGKNTVVVHGVGNAAGKLTPDVVDLKLGDGVILKNDDVQARVFTPKDCAEFTAAVTVPSMASSQPLVFKDPKTCTFQTDDVQPLLLTVNVAKS